jgi:hypothetical protein
MDRTISEIKQELHKYFQYLVPNFNKIDEIRKIWSEYNKMGISSPDIDAIMSNFPKHNEGFFQEIVNIASKVCGKELQIEFCPFILNDYNLCARSAKDGYLVIVDESYLDMFYMLANILMFERNNYIEEFEFYDLKSLVRNIIIDPIRNENRHKVFDQLVKRDYETAEFAVYLYNSFKIFMFAHEISHHILKHTNGTFTKQCHMNERSCNIEIDRMSYIHEFEADTYGYKIFLEVMNTVDDSINYAYCKYRYEYAPLLLFDIFDKIDRVQEEKENKKKTYPTHPSPIDRKENLLKQYKMNNPGILYYEDNLYSYNIMKDVLYNIFEFGNVHDNSN